ncbi:hypothetical protein RND81_08G164800 [Saponaria officinalis]|uniref:Uncharacterized protein n=1 Tax=Saponaria officinalis TaxID=3572 RepID=A0AAW1J905_SAPOF
MATDRYLKIFKDVIDHHIGKNDFDAALKMITSKLEVDTGDDDVRFYVSQLDKVLKAQPESNSMESAEKIVLDALMRLAYAWVETGEFERALKLTQVDLLHMGNALLEIRLYIFTRQDNTTEMARIIRKLYNEKISLRCPETHYILGNSFLRIDKVDLALQYFEKGVELVDKEDDEELFKRLTNSIKGIKSAKNAAELVKEEEENKRKEKLAREKQNQVKKALDGESGEEDGPASDLGSDKVDDEEPPGELLALSGSNGIQRILPIRSSIFQKEKRFRRVVSWIRKRVLVLGFFQ